MGPPVLSIPSLEIQRGERIFIYGPSGSGKTTLLGLLAGVLPPQQGKIEVLGQDLARLSPSQRDTFRGNHLGYIFQMFNLIPYLTVQDNILLSTDLNRERRTRITMKDRREAVLALASSLGIEGFLDRAVTQLSVGQQQRVAERDQLVGLLRRHDPRDPGGAEYVAFLGVAGEGEPQRFGAHDDAALRDGDALRRGLGRNIDHIRLAGGREVREGWFSQLGQSMRMLAMRRR